MHFSFRKSEPRPSRFLESLSYKIMKVIQEGSFGLYSMCGFQLTPEKNMYKNKKTEADADTAGEPMRVRGSTSVTRCYFLSRH